MRYLSMHLLLYLFSILSINPESEHVKSPLFLKKIVILQINYPTVKCGNEFYAYGYHFKVEGTDSSIVGILRCPDGFDKRFLKKDGRYSIEITNSNITDSLKGYAFWNPYKELNYPLYLISRIYKLK